MITLSTLLLSIIPAGAIFFLALPLAGLVSIIGVPLLIITAIVLGIGGIVIGIPAILLIVYFVFGNGLGSGPALPEILGKLLPF